MTVQYSQPTLDRWMYPFNSTPGVRPEAAVYATFLPGFDDRDAQVLFGFDMSAQIGPGAGLDKYKIRKVRVTIGQIYGDRYVYDPSFDPVATNYDPQDPQYVPDADPGKPIELFGAGYRNGFTALTLCETCPFGGAVLVPPSEGARNVFAATFDALGLATDASRQVRLRFEAPPMAIGQTTAAAPGAIVPADAVYTFDVDLCSPGARAYFERALDGGMLHLIISSLQLTTGGPGGGTNPNYPAFYTRENAFGLANGYVAKLDLIAAVGLQSDFNNDGVRTVADFGAFQTAFVAGDPAADINEDCTLTVADFGAFQTIFVLGR